MRLSVVGLFIWCLCGCAGESHEPEVRRKLESFLTAWSLPPLSDWSEVHIEDSGRSDPTWVGSLIAEDGTVLHFEDRLGTDLVNIVFFDGSPHIKADVALDSPESVKEYVGSVLEQYTGIPESEWEIRVTDRNFYFAPDAESLGGDYWVCSAWPKGKDDEGWSSIVSVSVRFDKESGKLDSWGCEW